MKGLCRYHGCVCCIVAFFTVGGDLYFKDGNGLGSKLTLCDSPSESLYNRTFNGFFRFFRYVRHKKFLS